MINNKFNVVQRLMRSRLSRRFIPWFAGFYQVDLEEIAQPISAYPHLESFFTRQLKAGARPFDDAAEVVVSPVDGTLSVVSNLSQSASFEVKGKVYQLDQFLNSAALAADYAGGTLLIFYLSPANYHRIHMPLAAREIRHYRLGKWSWPVNEWGLKWTRGLSTNYRLISQFESDQAEFIMVSVGALNVNSIVRLHESDQTYQKMDEYAYFAFGSTVVLLFPEGQLELADSTARAVQAGETIALHYKCK